MMVHCRNTSRLNHTREGIVSPFHHTPGLVPMPDQPQWELDHLLCASSQVETSITPSCIPWLYIYTVSLLLHFPSPSPLPPPHTHSTRLQALKEPVYTQKEAEMAAGMGNYVLQQPDTNITNVDMDRTT